MRDRVAIRVDLLDDVRATAAYRHAAALELVRRSVALLAAPEALAA